MVDALWSLTRPVPLDFNGPTDRPFVPLDKRALSRSPIERFDLMVDRYPDHVAIDDGRTTLTYLELQRVARALAHLLAEQTPPQQPIGAVMHYTALFPAALLASIAAARPLIPVDAAYPLQRQRMILDHAGAQTILVEAGVAIEVELPQCPRIEVDLQGLCASAAAAWPDIDYDCDRPGGVVFTSGSTGNPKGVSWSFGAFMPSVAEITATHHLNHEDKIIALGSLASAGLGDALFALLNGATLRVVEIMGAGLTELLRILGDEKITILSFVPAILRSILSMEGAALAFRHLRILDLYGDATSAADIAFFRTHLPAKCHIRVVLGSIEAGPIFHWFIPEDYERFGAMLPCGYIAANKEIALLDTDAHPVRLGAEGELFVRSRAMALGSWQQGRLTRGPFVQDPGDELARIYPMGDIVRMRPDGLCEFVGRRDRMVKVRGLRADLSEIEAALRAHCGLEDAVVVAVPEADDNRLVAYYKPYPGSPAPRVKELRRMVAQATADHMVPKSFHMVAEIPRLPNFKPDLVRLAAMAREGRAATI